MKCYLCIILNNLSLFYVQYYQFNWIINLNICIESLKKQLNADNNGGVALGLTQEKNSREKGEALKSPTEGRIHFKDDGNYQNNVIIDISK